jgi:S-adenosyl-L-methionine hydrolase (adenosine-forming)
MPKPIVTLLTDFGDADWYVAATKAAVLAHCGRRAVHVIDISHRVPSQDVTAGSILLERAVASFSAGTVHVAVVDPGVGTDRRLLAVRVRGQTALCPDNGLITWTWRRHGGDSGAVDARELTWRPPAGVVSTTFHGRDILAPAAGRLVAGTALGRMTRGLAAPLVLLDELRLADAAAGRGEIIHFDHYGNATTNVPVEVLSPGAVVRVKRKWLGVVRRTYGDAAAGEALALIGSSGLLELAVRNGSAREKLKLRIGDVVEFGNA